MLFFLPRKDKIIFDIPSIYDSFSEKNDLKMEIFFYLATKNDSLVSLFLHIKDKNYKFAA